VHVRLKGLNYAKVKLADGTKVVYWYAWRNGPRINGVPGSPEFIAHYNELISKRRSAPNGALLSVIDAFQQSLDFKDLAKSTKRSYVQHIKRIEKEFGDLPTKALSDRRVRGEFLAWRDKVGFSSGRRQADYAWSVLARILFVGAQPWSSRLQSLHQRWTPPQRQQT
jgi:hypothetical protein